jgi:geranyl-CoA carboxylase alpha subunit
MPSSQASLAPAQFSTLLIANRGEIAPASRSARVLGYRTVAVYSDADRGAAFVPPADPAPSAASRPRESYLRIDKIIAAARAAAPTPSTRAMASWPRTKTSRRPASTPAWCSSDRRRSDPAMGNKAGAKRLMQAAGVPCIPGYQGEDQSDAAARRSGRSACR